MNELTHAAAYAAPDPELAAYQRAIELAKAQLAEKDATIAALRAELKRIADMPIEAHTCRDIAMREIARAALAKAR